MTSCCWGCIRSHEKLAREGAREDVHHEPEPVQPQRRRPTHAPTFGQLAPCTTLNLMDNHLANQARLPGQLTTLAMLYLVDHAARVTHSLLKTSGLYEICYLNPTALPERLVPNKLNLGHRNKLIAYDLSVFPKLAVLMALYVHGDRYVALPVAFPVEEVEPHARGAR